MIQARTRGLILGLVVGWFGALAAHAIAHEMSGACFDVEPERPAVARPMMPAV